MSSYDRPQFDDPRDRARSYRDRDRSGRRGLRRNDEDDRGPDMSREREDWEPRGFRGSDTHESDERFGRREQYDPYYDEPGSRFGDRERGDFGSLEDWQRPRQLGGRTSEGQRSRDRFGSHRDFAQRGPGATGGFAGQGRYAGRGPKGYQRSDERLKEDICDRLTENSFVDASDIEVLVQDGEVTIQGSVRDRAMKRAAEDCIEDVSGVLQVHNRLRVEARDDQNDERGAGGFASARNQEGQRSSAGKKAH
jgi:hypothetical protein